MYSSDDVVFIYIYNVCNMLQILTTLFADIGHYDIILVSSQISLNYSQFLCSLLHSIHNYRLPTKTGFIKNFYA